MTSLFVIPSPVEQHRTRTAEECTLEASRAGAKAAVITCVATTIQMPIAVRKIPWFKRNLNFSAQALIISGATISSYFITADRTILKKCKEQCLIQNKLKTDELLSCCCRI